MSLSFCLIQASSPLQVKYADGELERLGEIFTILIMHFVLKMVTMNCCCFGSPSLPDAFLFSFMKSLYIISYLRK